MKHRVKLGSLLANSLLSMAVAAGIATLEGCGGGASSNSNPTDQLQAQAGAPTLAEGTTGSSGDSGTSTGGSTAPTGGITGGSTTPAPETAASTSGYTAPAGTIISGADGASQWRFSSTKTLAYSPGSVSTDASGSVLLNFDFGCQTSAIVVRQTDCRNTVSARRLLPAPVSVNGKAMLSIDVRNVDASANFAVMLWDATGQVLRYPLSLRGIENRSPNDVQRVYIQLNKPSSYWSGANDGVVHDNITAIAVSAQPFINDFATGGMNYPAGTLAFGDIRLHAASTFDYTLQTNAQRVNSAYPSYKGRLAVASDSLEPLYLDKALQAGIFTIRRDLNWEGAERSGVFNFNYNLGFMPGVQSRGMKVLWVLDYGHPDHGGTTPQTADDRQAYANFAQAAATAFKNKPVLAYELWNEPDSSIYWTSPDPVAFADLVARATSGIKIADSTAKVVTGGVVLGPDLSYLYRLAGQTTKLSQVDAIGVHPYRFDSFIYNNPYKRVSNSPEAFAADQAVLSNLMAAAGQTKPMWDTEAGYSSYLFLDSTRYGNGLDPRALNRQGVLTLRRVLTQLAMDAPLITLYSLYDTAYNATDREHNFGLLNADLNEKPSFVALKNLYNSVGQMNFKGYHNDVPPHTHALRWDSATTTARVFAMWNDDPDFSTTVTLPAGVTAVKTWLGNTITPTTTAGGAKQITLSEDAGPVFVFVN